MPKLFVSSRFLFFSVVFPLIFSISLYHLDTFDPSPFPSYALLPTTTSLPPLLNDHLLKGAEFLGVGLLKHPEDIAYHRDSNLIYTSTLDGWVKRVSVHESANDSVVEDWVNTGGRPLGIDFGIHGEVIVADAIKGLLNISGDGKKIELLTLEAEGVKFKLTDAVAVANDGVMYFTDASYKYELHEYLFDFVEGKPYGRLLSYDPTTRKTSVLVRDLYFANGVSLSPDQTYLIFCETIIRKCSKYYINEGRVEVLIQGLPGFPDNVRYDGDGHYWIAMFSGVTTRWQLLMKYPFLRKIVAIAAKYGVDLTKFEKAGVLQVDLDGNPIAMYYDRSLSSISSGIKIGNHLYCGNLYHSHIIRLDIHQYPATKSL